MGTESLNESDHLSTAEGLSTTVEVLREGGPSIWITSNFDGGSGKFSHRSTPDNIKIFLVNDPFSAYDNETFFQGWGFRVTGAKELLLKFSVENIHLANAGGDDQDFENYQARYSCDRKKWLVVEDTVFSKGQPLTFSITPASDVVYFAYAPIYGYQDHLDFLAGLVKLVTPTPFSVSTLGTSPQSRPVDLVTIGSPGPGKVKMWFTGRVHPGETYTSWWMEGCITRLLDDKDDTARQLLDQAVVYLVPNINPDSTALGFYRTSASGVNFNRVWDQASSSCAQELHLLQHAMKKTGVDFYLDVHTDENEEDNFIFWPGYGTQGDVWSEELERITEAFTTNYKAVAGAALTTDSGYPPDPPGTSPWVYGDTWVTGTFRAVGGTMEMTMKDLAGDRQPGQGWSPERAGRLGAQVVEPLLKAIPALKAYRGYGS